MSENIIDVSNISKSFGGRKVVDGLSLSVAQGEVFGLLGHNGAGKSTTIEMILGIKKPDGGSAQILGKDAAAHKKEIFEKVGVQLQSSAYQAAIKVGEICEEFASLYNEPADTASLLSSKKAALLKKIAELTAQIAVIDGYLSGPANALDTPVLIRKIPAIIVAAMEKRIDSYDELFSFMPEMGAEMERLGCECALPEYCFTHYLEPGYKDEHILIETCEAVTEKKEDSQLVKFRELPEITAACIFHKGSYDNFPETYASILRFIEENGYEICGNIRENYIDGIWNKDREEEWLSEIQIPVRMG